MPAAVAVRSLPERALEVLRRAGNPFRNYFARNPDDEVCARYHVPELFAKEREQLLAIVDLYRYDATTHSEVVPVLGNKGAGKTHLLHSIKHGQAAAWQMLVTPGTYQKDSEFLEYLLFQTIDTLLGGGKQQGARPIEFVGEELVRRLLTQALRELTPQQRLELFQAPVLGRWAQKLGPGTSQAHERTQGLLDSLDGRLSGPEPRPRRPGLGGRRARGAAGRCPGLLLRRPHRGPQHRRPDAPPHSPGLLPGGTARRGNRTRQLPDVRFRRAGIQRPSDAAGPGAGLVQGADGAVPRAQGAGGRGF